METQQNFHHCSSDITGCDEILVNVRKFERPAFTSIHMLMRLYTVHFRVITAFGNNALKIDLPTELLYKRIHNVFNVSQWKKYRSKAARLHAI